MEKELIFWLVLMVVLLVIELITVGLTCIWFAGGALAAVIVSVAGGPIWLQAVVFLAVSLLMLYFTRPWAMKYIQPKKVRTNYEEALGKDVRVIERVDNLKGTGKAMYNGMEWTARSEKEEVTFEPEDSAEVTGIEGVKLILRKQEEV